MATRPRTRWLYVLWASGHASFRCLHSGCVELWKSWELFCKLLALDFKEWCFYKYMNPYSDAFLIHVHSQPTIPYYTILGSLITYLIRVFPGWPETANRETSIAITPTKSNTDSTEAIACTAIMLIKGPQKSQDRTVKWDLFWTSMIYCLTWWSSNNPGKKCLADGECWGRGIAGCKNQPVRPQRGRTAMEEGNTINPQKWGFPKDPHFQAVSQSAQGMTRLLWVLLKASHPPPPNPLTLWSGFGHEATDLHHRIF